MVKEAFVHQLLDRSDGEQSASGWFANGTPLANLLRTFATAKQPVRTHIVAFQESEGVNTVYQERTMETGLVVLPSRTYSLLSHALIPTARNERRPQR